MFQTFAKHLNHCIACGSEQLKPWQKKRFSYTEQVENTEFQIVRCQQCGTGFLNPPPHADLLKSIYQYSGHALTSPISLATVLAQEKQFPNSTIDANRIVSWAQRLNQSGNYQALDIGSGYGFYTQALKLAHYDTVSINPGKYENQVFKAMNGNDPLPIMFDDFNTSNLFGVILMSQVLEHLVEPEHAIAKVANLLANQGVFACAVPHFNALTVKILGTKDNACLWVPEHVNYFTVQGVRKLLTQHDLKIIHIHQITRFRYDALSRRLLGENHRSFILDGIVKYGQIPFNYLANVLRMGIYLNIYAIKNG